jgi:hypothetical protein
LESSAKAKINVNEVMILAIKSFWVANFFSFSLDILWFGEADK